MRNRIANFVGRRRSGGAAQAFDSPAPFRTLVLSDEEILLEIADIGQDNVKFYRNTTDNFESATEIYDGANNTYSDTGRTAGTNYYYYAVASLSGAESAVLSKSATTLSWRPDHFYESNGLKYNVDDDWADMSNSIIDNWKDSLGSGPDFVKSFTTGPTRGFNRKQITPVVTSGSNYFTFTPIQFALSSSLTIAFEFYNTNSAGTKRFIVDSVTGNIIQINSTNVNIQIQLNGSTLVNHNISGVLPGGVLPLGKVRIVVTRSGTTSSVQVNGYTPVTATMATSAFEFNTLLNNRSGGNFAGYEVTKLLIDKTNVRTDAQVLEWFNRLDGDAYSSGSEAITAPIFTGSWEGLTDGRTSDLVSINDNGTPNGIKVMSNDDYTYVLAKKPAASPTFNDMLLAAIRHSDGKITPRTSLPHYLDNDDGHNAQQLVLDNDDAIVYAMGHNVHTGLSGAGIPQNKLVMRSGGKGFNIKNFYDRIIEKNVSDAPGNGTAYDNPSKIGDIFYNVQQGWTTGGQESVFAWSLDGGNHWNELLIVDAGSSGDWLYPIGIYSEGDYVYYAVLYRKESDTTYRSLSIFRSAVSSGFLTWTDVAGANSFNPVTDGPRSLAQIMGTYQVYDVSGGTVKNAPCTNIMVTNSGFVYGGCGDGENTAWRLFWYDSGWQFQTLDFGAYSVKLPTLPGTDYNRNHPIIYRTGVDAYTIFALVDNSGAYRIAKFTTTDAGATTLTFVEYVSSDDGNKYWNMQRLHNYEFVNAGWAMATAVASDGLSATPFFYQVK